MAGSGTVTLLFTDLVGSTESLVALGEDRYDPVRDEHEGLVAGTIGAYHGEVVKSTGDGYMGAFPRAGDAVGAAAEIQRLVSRRNKDSDVALEVRIGISAGDVVRRGGDYHGVSAVEAARLCDAAGGGQILVSATVRSLVGSRGGHDFVALGDLDLKGLPPVATLAVRWCDDAPVVAPAGGAKGDLPVLPTAPFARVDDELVGRRVELERLEDAWTRARDGVRQVALVAGEPGIGKTRLAAEVSSLVSRDDGVALYGRCDEEGIVPYQPFVEALRPSVAAYSATALHQRLHGLEQDLARVFPDLLGRLPEQPQSIPNDAESERYRLFEAFTALLTGISATQPTVLVLDDLHWADKPTLLLLRHVVRSLPDAALLVVVCYREMELATDHPLCDLVVDLRREYFVTYVCLDGLTEADSRMLLEGLARVEIAPALSAVLHGGTGGNPLFLEELLRHLTETERLPLNGADGAEPIDITALDLPEGVRDVVARRLRRLPTWVNDVLGLAAVIGVEFDAALLERAALQPTEEVLEALDQAMDARLVRRQPGQDGRYAFSHALIRQTVYKELRTARRAKLHESIGSAMEEAGPDARASALAYHFTEAIPIGTAPKAIEYTERAGQAAIADLAFEDAVVFFERALDLLEQHVPDDQAQRVELLTDLADALVEVDERAGVEAALRAVDAARGCGSPEQFGRAVAVFSERKVLDPTYQPADLANLYDEARTSIGGGHPALRARLLALEAFDYATDVLHDRDARALAEEALGLARSAGDPEALTLVLFSLACSLEGTPDVAERVAIGEELVSLGRRGAGRTATAEAFGLRVLAGARLEVGDAEALTSTITELARIGEELHWFPAHAYAALWQVTQAIVEGRFEDVRTYGTKMREYVRAYRGVAGMHEVQLFYLAREQGNLEKFIPVLEGYARELKDNFNVRAMLALAQIDVGEESAALRHLDDMAANNFGSEQRGRSAWAAMLGWMAEVAASGGTPHQTALLYNLLTPFGGRLLAASLGLGCLGAADRYLGMLSTALERLDKADEHFQRAVALEERIRGRALLPRTRYWHAKCLRARRRHGDEGRARALLRTVTYETSQLGMKRLCAQAQELSDR